MHNQTLESSYQHHLTSKKIGILCMIGLFAQYLYNECSVFIRVEIDIERFCTNTNKIDKKDYLFILLSEITIIMILYFVSIMITFNSF